MYRGFAVIVGMSISLGANGDTSFYKDVQPILQDNCVNCHRPSGADNMGMIAPMPLRTYREVRPWAKSIARQVKDRTMPPWHAAPEFKGVFSNERTLTKEQIDTIVSWVDAGAKKGPGSDPEILAEEDTGWTIGEPDLIVPFDEPYWVADWVDDHYASVRVRLTKEQLPKDRWIKAMQFRPGSEVVHHIVIYTDDYRESMGFPTGMLGGTGPGTDATIFPDGYGRFLEAGTQLAFNMHYHKESGPGTGMFDLSEIAFVFHDKSVKHEVSWGAVGSNYISIPPYADNYEVVAEEVFRKATTLLALFPHTHLRGKASKYTAFYPDGTEEVLLHVPNYDFNWQTNYVFKEPKKIPAGTRIKVQMWYDNSEERAEYTGIDPSRTVRWGQPTTDEMMYGWIDYTSGEVKSSDD
jgi:hypothetical protein